MRKLVLLVALSIPCLAFAQDVKDGTDTTETRPPRESRDPEGKRSIGFASTVGLTGMRDLIDARVPSTINVRGMIRFDNESLNLDSASQSHSLDTYDLDLIAGASLLGMLDAGFHLPLQYRVVRDALHGGPSRRISADGVSDAEISGKVGFALGPWISIGPYATLHWNTGSSLLDKTNELRLGGCGTLSFLDDRVAAHVNFTNINYDGGKWALGYRLGASVVPLLSDFLLLRVFVYLDGKDFIGTRVQGNDTRIFGGVQALFFKFVTAEFSMGWKIYNGDLPVFVHDVSTYGIDVGGGVSFSF